MMSMKNFFLVDVFPVREADLCGRDVAMLKYSGKEIPDRKECRKPNDLAKFVIDNYEENGLPNALHSALEKSSNYIGNIASLPNISEVPSIHRYRNDHANHNPVDTKQEVLENGKFLATSQVLYHGGNWPSQSGQPTLGEKIHLDKLLSTSLCPQVATWHAISDAHKQPTLPFLWEIHVGKACQIPAFFFKIGRNNRHGGEFEVLIAPNCCATVTKIVSGNTATLVSVTLN